MNIAIMWIIENVFTVTYYQKLNTCVLVIGKRRRSSLYPGLESFAAIALSSALGNHPSLALEDSDDDNSLDSSRQSGRTPVIHTVSNGSIGSIGSDLSFNMNPTAGTEPCGLDNPVFDNDDPMPPTYDEVALNTKL